MFGKCLYNHQLLFTSLIRKRKSFRTFTIYNVYNMFGYLASEKRRKKKYYMLFSVSPAK